MSPEDEAPVTPEEAMVIVREGLKRFPDLTEGALQEGDFGDPVYRVLRDLPHLDADALNDRLHAWVTRELREDVLTDVSAFVSFREARPATGGEGELDQQEHWHDVAAVFRLDVQDGRVTRRDVETWVRLVPAFLHVVRQEGRPDGWRDVWAGAAE